MTRMDDHGPRGATTPSHSKGGGVRQAFVNIKLPDDLRHDIKQMMELHRSPEWKAYWSAAKAAMDGDEAPIRTWAEERIGHRPDSVLRVRLGKNALSEDSPAETWAVVDERGARRRKEAKARDVKGRTAQIRVGIKRFPHVDLALEVLALGDQNHEQVLLEMIPGLAYELQDHFSDAELPGKIAAQLRREGIEKPHKPGEVLAQGTELPAKLLKGSADEQEAISFALRETLARAVHAGELSHQELESWFFATLFGNTEAAGVLERSPNQVAQEKSRASKKLNQAS
jgi:hypothetical protein